MNISKIKPGKWIWHVYIDKINNKYYFYKSIISKKHMKDLGLVPKNIVFLNRDENFCQDVGYLKNEINKEVLKEIKKKPT